MTIANRAVSRGTNGRPVSIPSAVVAEVDTVNVVESGTIGVEQLTSPWVVSGTVTTPPSGTQDVNIVGDTANLMKSTSGTIAQVTLIPAVTTVATVSALTSGSVNPVTGATWDMSDRAARDMGKVDIAAFDSALPAGTNAIGSLYGTTSTINAVIQTDNVSLMKSTGGTISQVTTVSALTSGTVVTTPTGNIPLDRNEYIQRDLQTNVATGVTSYTINLSKGTTNRALKEIYLYCASAGAGMYYDIALGTSTLGEAYYGDTTFLTWDKTNWIASGTITVSLNTGAAAASTVNTTLKYYYD